MSKIIEAFRWSKNNIALSFFLLLEAVALVFAMGWLVQNALEKGKDVPTYVSANEVLSNSISSDVQEFNAELSSKIRIKVNIKESNEQAINDFLKDRTDILLLDQPLPEDKIAAINQDRLPLVQKELKLNRLSNLKGYLIYDKDANRRVRKFANQVVSNHT